MDRTPTPDYPFYRAEPVAISGWQWLAPLAGVVLATAILVTQPAIFSHGYLRMLPGILLAVLPLAGLALVAGRHWTALFRRVGPREVGLMFGFAILNFIIAVPLGFLAMKFIDTQVNPGIAGMAAASAFEKVLFFANSLPQLVGEELISIIPFLALLHFLTRAGLSTRNAVVVAWLVTAVWFAAIHLPTYNWNFLQCLLLIGGARLVLTLAYIKTKNLWVSAGAHIINDWITFGLAVFLPAAAAG